VLLAVGLLQPRQAVWHKDSHDILFVHAATAAAGVSRLETLPDADRRPERGVTIIAPYGEEIKIGG
jgi:hypothetical protein